MTIYLSICIICIIYKIQYIYIHTIILLINNNKCIYDIYIIITLYIYVYIYHSLWKVNDRVYFWVGEWVHGFIWNRFLLVDYFPAAVSPFCFAESLMIAMSMLDECGSPIK